MACPPSAATAVEGELNLPEGYSYLGVEPTKRRSPDDRCFRIKEIEDADGAKKWIGQLMESSFVTWIVTNTRPEGQINIFKQYLCCHHATYKRVTGKRSSKKTDCPATLTISVQRYIKKSRSKVEGRIVPGWPTIVHFSSAHNHMILSAAALKYRDLCDESRTRLSALFRAGHSPSSALQALRANLLLEHGDNYYIVAADGHYVPSLSIVHKLFAKEFGKVYGSLLGEQMLADLQVMLGKYEGEGVCRTSFERVGGHYCVALCTPIMQRAHELAQAGDWVLVDVIGGLDRQKHRIYFFLLPTAAGGVPVGVIITDSDRLEVFEAGLNRLKDCVPGGAFHQRGFPTVFQTSYELREREALQRVFPQSRVLVGRFHVQRVVWAWLIDVRHGVAREHCDQLYAAFVNILHASELELPMHYQTLVYSQLYHRYANFATFFQTVWNCRAEWAFAFRQRLPSEATSATDYVEVAHRILKHCVFERVIALNLTQLVDFIVTLFEGYVHRRLVDFCSERYSKPSLRGTSVAAGTPASSSLDCFVTHASAGMYDIKSPHSGDPGFSVDLTKGVCSCDVGKNGRLCRHAAAVLLKVDAVGCTRFQQASATVRSALFRVATGAGMVPGWLLPLHCKDDPEGESKDSGGLKGAGRGDAGHEGVEQLQEGVIGRGVIAMDGVRERYVEAIDENGGTLQLLRTCGGIEVEQVGANEACEITQQYEACEITQQYEGCEIEQQYEACENTQQYEMCEIAQQYDQYCS